MTLDEAVARIRPADAEAKRAAELRQASLTKPPGSLGRLEDLSIQLAGIFGTDRPVLGGKTVIVAAADHGVVAQGVTGYPQAVTAQMVLNFLAGGAAINVMARKAGVELVIVDAGVATPLPDHPDLRRIGMGAGAGDITQGPAMTREEAEACVDAGVGLAMDAIEDGADLLGTGDMGIGNTTASSAVTAALTRRPPQETTGRGTGRNDEELERKIDVVARALEVNRPDPDDGLDVLAKVGGFEIGVLAGVVLGAALARRPVVLDGFISGAAGLIALQPLRRCQGLCDCRAPVGGDGASGGVVALGTATAVGPGHEARRGYGSGAGDGRGGSGSGLSGGDGNLRGGRRLRPEPIAGKRAAPMKSLRLAIGFLTIFPLAPSGRLQMGPARAWFPLVGLALGGILAGLDLAAREALPPTGGGRDPGRSAAGADPGDSHRGVSLMPAMGSSVATPRRDGWRS